MTNEVPYIDMLRTALLFVPNRGQSDTKSRFYADVPGQSFYFHDESITVILYYSARKGQGPPADETVKGAVLKLAFAGANVASPRGLFEAEGQYHNLIGSDIANWRTHVPGYRSLRYENLYDGVDLTLAGGEYGLKFLWSLKCADRAGAIRLRYEGAEEIYIAEDGRLVIRHPLGELYDPAPVAWQEIDAKNVPVICSYTLKGNQVSFVLYGAYDADAPLFIDPVLPYSTYLGGSSMDAVE